MGFHGDTRVTRLACESTASGLVLNSCPNIRSLLSAGAGSQALSPELRDAAVQYLESSVVPYPVIRDVWVQLTPGYGVPFCRVLEGSSFVLESPKPREMSKELKERLAKLQVLADEKAYGELVKDVVKHDQDEQPVKQQVQALTAKVEEIERKVAEVTQRRNAERKSKGKSGTAGKDRDRGGAVNKKQLEINRRDAARSRRMQELMRQVLSIWRQISLHKWAWPFMKPVDVKGLGLHDYNDVIEKPMDLGTIKNRIDAKDASGYQHVQEVCDDIRLVFSNAMTYNPEGSDVHVMSKTLSDRFEERWKSTVEPKLHEEELKRLQEDNEAQVKGGAQGVEETDTEKLTELYTLQLEELDKQLEELKQQATPKFSRAMSVEEKRHLGQSLGKLAPDNLSHVIQIIAQKNPSFNINSDEVEVDIDAQDPATLWRLHRYVQAAINAAAMRQATPRNPPTKRSGVALPNKSSSKRGKKATTP